MCSSEQLAVLRSFDTPTMCNAIELICPQRRGSGFTVDPLFSLDPAAGPMVGYARTATMRAMRPSGRTGSADVDVRVGYYQHIAEGPGPTVTVIEDLDPHPGYGALWGEVNSNVHRALGSLGVITNGSIRDLDDWADGFQALAGSVGPSHGFVHVVDYDVSVTVAGMQVKPGDLVHADRHGAVVVPPEAVDQIATTVAAITKAEHRLIDPAKAGELTIERLVSMLRPEGDH
jgi:regulator of RNase E activity RraA